MVISNLMYGMLRAEVDDGLVEKASNTYMRLKITQEDARVLGCRTNCVWDNVPTRDEGMSIWVSEDQRIFAWIVFLR